MSVVLADGTSLSPPSSWSLVEWPAIPFLAGFAGTAKDVVIRAATDEQLAQIAGTYSKIVWSGLGAVEDPGWRPADRAAIARELVRQAQYLSQCGSRQYLELSALPEAPVALAAHLALVRDLVFAGRLSFVGINQEELLKATRSGNSIVNPVWVWPNVSERPEPLFERYFRAARLAEFLGCDVFVHGTECSIYLTKTRAPDILERLSSYLLLANLAVVASLLDRAGLGSSRPFPWLAEKGFVSLLQFGYDVDKTIGGNSALVRQIVRDGFLSADHGLGFSVVLVPSLWPEEVSRVNAAGAGDTVSSVLAYFYP